LFQFRCFVERYDSDLIVAFFNHGAQEHRFSDDFIKIRPRNNLSGWQGCFTPGRIPDGSLGVFARDFTRLQVSLGVRTETNGLHFAAPSTIWIPPASGHSARTPTDQSLAPTRSPDQLNELRFDDDVNLSTFRTRFQNPS